MLHKIVVILCLLALISCAHQKTYFGVAEENTGDPLFGYYKCGQFISVRLGEDYEQRMQGIISFNRSFRVGKVFTGIMADGGEIKVQIKSKKDYREGLGDNIFEVEIWQAGKTILPMTDAIFWTPNIRVKFLKPFDIKLDEAALKQIQSEALRLWKEALEELPEDDEMRTLSRIELLSPTIQKVEGVEEVVTVFIPTLVKTPASFVEEGLKHEFEHVDDGASVFFIYSALERKIVFGSFGHGGWDPHAIRVVTVKPLIYFRILGDSSVYFLGEHSFAWEHHGYAIFDLKLGKVLMSSD
jgi:hypothetical protein